MRYQLSLVTRNHTEADLFDEFKETAKRDGKSHMALFTEMMRLYRQDSVRKVDQDQVELLKQLSEKVDRIVSALEVRT